MGKGRSHQQVDPLEDGHDADMRFWKKYLAGAPAVLELPRDHRRPEPPEYRAASEPLVLSQTLTTGLRTLSEQEQVTLRTALTAGVVALLHRYTGQEDVLIGSPVPRKGRVARGGRTAVLRVDLAGQPTVLELLKRVRSASDATRGRQGIPFDAVVNTSGPQAGASYHPLVQVTLLFGPTDPASAERSDSAPTDDPSPAPGFDLQVELDDGTSEVAGRLVYDSTLFERKTILRMVEHLEMILEGMVAEPWSPVGELRLLAPEERQQLLEEWSAGGEIAAGPDITTMIVEQANARPDSVAMECEGQSLTYRELNERTNQLARYLQAQGVRPEVPVGVCLARSVEQVVALLGILKAGGAYVPLDPDGPAERARYVIEDAGMPLILTTEPVSGKVSGTDAEVVCLDLTSELLSQLGEGEVDGSPRADQLAYVIYTSGSTGQPKGVMVDRGALSAHCRTMIPAFGLGPEDAVLQFSPYSFDASLEQILLPLAVGGRMVMRGPELWTPSQLLEVLETRDVTVMSLSPAYLQQALREWTRRPERLAGLALRLVVVGGDRLGTQTVQHWRELGLTDVGLINAYGPTEATITSTLGEVGDETDPVTIGRPLPGRSVYVLDRGGRPVPVGVVGELHIGGGLLARGYLNRPELTEERFVPDPYGGEPTGRLYRSGDLVRYLKDGRILYIGREDQQVQVRGQRVELGEVEEALAQHPAVEEAVVVVRTVDGDVRLAAYVVAAEDPHLEETLRRHLAERLPDYMQPSAIVTLEEMPRLATGKPDRRSLPELGRKRRQPSSEYLAPQQLAQEQLMLIWEELLEPRPIGIRDNFFHLGGHSLLAAQLVYRIEETFGQKVALSTLFANPTIEQLAEVLQERQEGSTGRARVQSVQAEGSRTPFFFLHGDWTKGAFYCFALARSFGPEQPFYVLEPYSFDREEGAATLEELARSHVDAMRGVQATGPYRLGGFCNGGLLAYEMARQLEAEGEQVEFLGLITPSNPFQSSLLRVVCDAVGDIGRLGRRRGAGEPRRPDFYLRTRHALRHVYRRLRPDSSRVEDFGKLVAIEPALEGPFPPKEALYKDYVGVFSWAAVQYRTGIFHGKVTYYWPREEPEIAGFWRPVVGHKYPTDVEEHVVAGSHMSCITYGISGLASTMSESLRRVEEESRAVEQPDQRPLGEKRSFRVRPIRARDLREVVSIKREAFPDDPWTTTTAKGRLARSAIGNHPRYAGWLERFFLAARGDQAVFLIRLLALVGLGRPAGLRYIVAEEESAVVGFACIETPKDGEGDVQIIAVRQDRQRQGIGESLLDHLVATATGAGCAGVGLVVRADNDGARSLYRRAGFTETETLPGYYRPSRTDAIAMRLDLPGRDTGSSDS